MMRKAPFLSDRFPTDWAYTFIVESSGIMLGDPSVAKLDVAHTPFVRKVCADAEIAIWVL